MSEDTTATLPRMITDAFNELQAPEVMPQWLLDAAAASPYGDLIDGREIRGVTTGYSAGRWPRWEFSCNDLPADTPTTLEFLCGTEITIPRNGLKFMRLRCEVDEVFCPGMVAVLILLSQYGVIRAHGPASFRCAALLQTCGVEITPRGQERF